MRVKLEGRRTLFGTSLEVVKELGKYVLLDDREESVDRHMMKALKRMGSKKKLLDKTLEKRCESFLKELEKHADVKIL